MTRLRAVAVALLVVAAVAAFSGRFRHEMRDFEVYWTAGQRALAGEPLYRAADGHYQFKYLPAFAVLCVPLGALPLQAAKATWFAISVAFLVLFVVLCVRSLPGSAFGEVTLATLTVVAMAKFYAHELVLGQANLLMGALVMAALALWQRNRPQAAGWVLGAAFAVKPYAVFLLPYLLAIRRWHAAVTMAVASVVVLLAPVVVYGTGGNAALLTDWWRVVVATSEPLLTGADSVSVFAMYAKWIGWGPAARVLSIVTIAALVTGGLLVLGWRGRVREPELLEVGLILAAIPLITPQGWDYMLLLSTPLVAALIAHAPRLPRADAVVVWTTLAVVAFSLFDLMGRAAYARFMALSVITVCYLVLFAIAMRVRRLGAQ